MHGEVRLHVILIRRDLYNYAMVKLWHLVAMRENWRAFDVWNLWRSNVVFVDPLMTQGGYSGPLMCNDEIGVSLLTWLGQNLHVEARYCIFLNYQLIFHLNWEILNIIPRSTLGPIPVVSFIADCVAHLPIILYADMVLGPQYDQMTFSIQTFNKLLREYNM